MHRIDHPTAVAAPPPPQPAGAPGYYRNGNPAAGQAATVVGADHLNAIQEEIAGVVEAGGLVLDKGDNGQMQASIATQIAAAVAAASGWVTGDLKPTFAAAAPAGWVMADDGSIGAAGSGATTRAHADCEALYALLWSNVADAWAPVTGGRGASSAADWAAGKALALPKMLGRTFAVAGAGDGLTARALGEVLGAETHVLTIAEMPSHVHPPLAGTAFMVNTVGVLAGTGAANISGAATTGAAGGGLAHSNMQPSVCLNVMVKL